MTITLILLKPSCQMQILLRLPLLHLPQCPTNTPTARPKATPTASALLLLPLLLQLLHYLLRLKLLHLCPTFTCEPYVEVST